MIEAGLFPAPVRLSPRREAFIGDELAEWQAARIAERETPRPKREVPAALRKALAAKKARR
jgi:hypothetical protein